MIEDIIGTYLVQQQVPTDKYPATSPPDSISLCIIETRKTFWLPLVINNALIEFPGCRLHVIAPADVHIWLGDKFPAVRPVIMPPHQGSRNTFNATLYNPDFWDIFSTPYVLLFQCDTCFVPGAASKLPTLPSDIVYWGAACGQLQPDTFVINGGLSLRHVQTFRRLCTTLTEDQLKRDEDVVFTQLLREQGARLPTIEQCMNFAVESFGNPSRVIGIHGSDKYYCPQPLIASMFMRPNRPIIDCVMYNGEPILEKRLHLLENVVDRFIVVESRLAHSGTPKELEFYRHLPDGHPKITYVVVESYPSVPDDFGKQYPWVTKASKEAWWRESVQRDEAAKHVPTNEQALVVVSDVDELPNPYTLVELSKTDLPRPVHLKQVFLLYSAKWVKFGEHWNRAYVCDSRALPQSFTAERCASGTDVPTVDHGGWHCSSFFDVETHIRKVQHFAHREFKDEIDADTITERILTGKDPFGRGPAFDATESHQHLWIDYV